MSRREFSREVRAVVEPVGVPPNVLMSRQSSTLKSRCRDSFAR